MPMNRREFVVLSLATVAAGCTAGAAGGPKAGDASGGSVVDVGPAADYAADGVYDRFKARGFFLVRRDGQLVAISSICTHRACALQVQRDQSYRCPCHGSTFDPAGKVTKGPAARDLAALSTAVNANGHLLVTTRS